MDLKYNSLEAELKKLKEDNKHMKVFSKITFWILTTVGVISILECPIQWAAGRWIWSISTAIFGVLLLAVGLPILRSDQQKLNKEVDKLEMDLEEIIDIEKAKLNDSA